MVVLRSAFSRTWGHVVLVLAFLLAVCVRHAAADEYENLSPERERNAATAIKRLLEGRTDPTFQLLFDVPVGYVLRANDATERSDYLHRVFGRVRDVHYVGYYLDTYLAQSREFVCDETESVFLYTYTTAEGHVAEAYTERVTPTRSAAQRKQISQTIREEQQTHSEVARVTLGRTIHLLDDDYRKTFRQWISQYHELGRYPTGLLLDPVPRCAAGYLSKETNITERRQFMVFSADLTKSDATIVAEFKGQDSRVRRLYVEYSLSSDAPPPRKLAKDFAQKRQLDRRLAWLASTIQQEVASIPEFNSAGAFYFDARAASEMLALNKSRLMAIATQANEGFGVFAAEFLRERTVLPEPVEITVRMSVEAPLVSVKVVARDATMSAVQALAGFITRLRERGDPAPDVQVVSSAKNALFEIAILANDKTRRSCRTVVAVTEGFKGIIPNVWLAKYQGEISAYGYKPGSFDLDLWDDGRTVIICQLTENKSRGESTCSAVSR